VPDEEIRKLVCNPFATSTTLPTLANTTFSEIPITNTISKIQTSAPQIIFLRYIEKMSPAKHPLDPLAPSEITQISSLLKSLSPDRSLHFKIISITEPPKAQLRAYLKAERNGNSLPPLPRRASALYYLRGTSQLFKATVNVDANTVEHVGQLESHFHGQADVNEIIEMRDACLSNPKVLQRIEAYKLPPHLKVVCDTWPYGRDSKDHHPRYVQVSTLNLRECGTILKFGSVTSSWKASIPAPTTTTCPFPSRQSLT
jgi:Cu2+-containing amine oxidase